MDHGACLGWLAWADAIRASAGTSAFQRSPAAFSIVMRPSHQPQALMAQAEKPASLPASFYWIFPRGRWTNGPLQTGWSTGEPPPRSLSVVSPAFTVGMAKLVGPRDSWRFRRSAEKPSSGILFVIYPETGRKFIAFVVASLSCGRSILLDLGNLARALGANLRVTKAVRSAHEKAKGRDASYCFAQPQSSTRKRSRRFKLENTQPFCGCPAESE
ncbi:hypothetical protein B0J18DRAFT_164131 [Chaetomium sp. MPI-SDFR-AT-0129]|nr:hypothetical protein B0J18DRAFT_164131 [Chaetomium sp. MPI-SDFR-AT-0129]